MAVVGIDLGTGSTKVAVVADDGRVLARRSYPHDVSSPQPAAAETEPGAWLISVREASNAALAEAGHPRVEAIGLSGQMHGVVCVGTDGKPLGPALLWADVRPGDAIIRAYDQLDAADRRALANPVVPGMFGPLLAWFLTQYPELRTRLRWALPPKDWLRAVMTGRACTEPSDASATLLWDMPASQWSSAACDALGVPASALPPIIGSDHVAGRLRPYVADLFGLPKDTPVAAGAADVAAGIVGSGLGVGQAQLSVGTGAQLVVPLADLRAQADPVTHRYLRAEPSAWYAMAAVQNAGLALQWVRDVLGASWDDMHASLDQVPAGAAGVTFHGYLTGERTPVLDTDLRAAWQGMGLHTGRPALLRAALEGVAFALRDARDALVAEGIGVGDLRLVGGGGGDSRWRTLLATVLGSTLTIHRLADVSVVGAARLAASSVGIALPPATDDNPTTVEPETSDALEDAWRRWRRRRPSAIS